MARLVVRLGDDLMERVREKAGWGGMNKAVVGLLERWVSGATTAHQQSSKASQQRSVSVQQGTSVEAPEGGG